MRLDYFLKCTGLIPRRTVAKAACDEGLIEINGKVSKAAAEVSVGDIIKTRTGLVINEYEVLQLATRPVARALRDDYVRLISTVKVEVDW